MNVRGAICNFQTLTSFRYGPELPKVFGPRASASTLDTVQNQPLVARPWRLVVAGLVLAGAEVVATAVLASAGVDAAALVCIEAALRECYP